MASFYEPGDELCPIWWPFPFPWPGPRRDGREDLVIPADARVTLAMFRSLTLYNIAFQIEDAGASHALKQLALGQLDKQMGDLANSAKR